MDDSQRTFNYEDYITTHFKYHKDGSITRDDRNGSNGSLDKDGYLIIKIKGKQFKAHRIVWLLNYGRFPSSELDHINRIRTDNRIENLRESSRQQQVENRTEKINKDTGAVGIYYDRTRGLLKHYAFRKSGKTYRFRKLEDAVAKKNSLSEEFHG